MESASRRASDRPAPGSPTVAREDADSPAIRRSGPTTAAAYAAWALALHGLIERSRASSPESAPDWWEDDPAPLRAGADGELDEALACLLLFLPLGALVPSEPAAPRAGETGRARVPAPELWALSRPRPCAGQRPAGVCAMPPSSPGQACWERVRGPISQAITLVPHPALSDRLVLGDIAQPAAAGPNRAGGGSGLRRETVAAFAGGRR